MALVQNKQPETRFNLAGPMGIQGISFLPKVVTFFKDAISGTSDNDFWVAPPGTFIAQAFIRAHTALDGSGTATLGTDGNPDALIDSTDFTPTTIGNSASNIGSATAVGAIGLYLKDGDTIRLAICGSPTVGALSGFLVYYEMGAMINRGKHFDID